jgi:uncharacterized protein YukE
MEEQSGQIQSLRTEFDGKLKQLQSALGDVKARVHSDLGDGKLGGNIVRNIDRIKGDIDKLRTEFNGSIQSLKEAASRKDSENFRELEQVIQKNREEFDKRLLDAQKQIDASANAIEMIDVDLRGDKTDVNPGILYNVKYALDWISKNKSKAEVIASCLGIGLTLGGFMFQRIIDARIEANTAGVEQATMKLHELDKTLAEEKARSDSLQRQIDDLKSGDSK